MSDSSGGAPGPITAPFAAIEPNVIVAGLEATVVIWIGTVSFTGGDLVPQVVEPWRWWYAAASVFVLLGVLLLGLAAEGLAGLVEYVATRRLRRPHRGELRNWYKSVTVQPPDWGPGQRWMWKSGQASQEFARRRMRILTARNTTFLIGVLWVVVTIALVTQRPSSWGLSILAFSVGSAGAFLLFGWIWVRAHHAWNAAVADAGDIGPP